jgi:NitT/TauT family transport system substrate-binding protein
MRMRRLVPVLAVLGLVASACASSEAKLQGSSEVLRLGMFPNLTHAPAYVGLEEGIFERVLAPTTVEVSYFNSGSDAGTALTSGSIDATYIGPGPAISLYLADPGSVALVSGVTSGGASFVVRAGSGIETAADLSGKKLAVPGVGNTQDVSLRTWLHEHGLKTNDENGEVHVGAIDNTLLVQSFESGEFDGAWEPEPWPSLLMAEGLAEPFLDEATLWPEGEFVTTHLLVNTAYLDEHPDVVRKLVEANVEAIRLANEEPDRAKAAAQAGLIKAGAPSLDQTVVDAAWAKLTFTWDPIAASLEKDATDAYALGYLETEPTGILDIYRLDILNRVLAGLTAVPPTLPSLVPEPVPLVVE